MSNEPTEVDWLDERTEAEVLAARSVDAEELSPGELFAQIVRKALG